MERNEICIMNKFDTKVQFLKYEVLREVARHAWQDDLLSSMMDIPKEITQSDHPAPATTPTRRWPSSPNG